MISSGHTGRRYLLPAAILIGILLASGCTSPAGPGPATVPPATTGGPGPVTTTPVSIPPGPVTVSITAKDNAFNTTTITVNSGQPVTIIFRNEDAGTAHNIAFYDTPLLGYTIYKGDFVIGPGTVVYNFTAPDDPGGIHYFQCNGHPNLMSGKLVEV